MERIPILLMVGVLALGCASRGEPASATPEPVAAKPEPAPAKASGASAEDRPVSAAAARIYKLGEQRYAEGRYPEAVALWGHALLQLSPDASADAVRHKLFARMGHGLLMAHASTGDPQFLADGKEMCELYLAKHEELFGDTEKARAARGDFYELLYEFEWRLENAAEPSADEPSSDTASVAAASMGEVARTAEAAKAPKAAETPAETPAETESTAEIAAADVEIDEGDELYRFIKVRKIEWATLDDPSVQAYHADDRFLGPSLLDYGSEPVQGPRVLVRVAGLPRPLDAEASASTRKVARRLAYEVIRRARPALQQCYEVAMARSPVLDTRVDVSLTVERDGTVKQPLLVAGSLIDAEGDVCLAEALRDVALSAPEHGEALAVSVPLLFFSESEKTAGELIRHADVGSGRGYEHTTGPEPMPPIDEWAR